MVLDIAVSSTRYNNEDNYNGRVFVYDVGTPSSPPADPLDQVINGTQVPSIIRVLYRNLLFMSGRIPAVHQIVYTCLLLIAANFIIIPLLKSPLMKELCQEFIDHVAYISTDC